MTPLVGEAALESLDVCGATSLGVSGIHGDSVALFERSLPTAGVVFRAQPQQNIQQMVATALMTHSPIRDICRKQTIEACRRRAQKARSQR